MSSDGTVRQRGESEISNDPGLTQVNRSFRSNETHLVNPNATDQPEGNEDLQLKFHPALYSNLNQYLPPSKLNMPWNSKIEFMNEILSPYSNEAGRNRVRKSTEHREKLISTYQPLHKELYTLYPTMFFVPSFLRAIDENTEASLKSIISEPSPGLYTFEMLHPHFCKMMIDEVCHLENWLKEGKHDIMQPTSMHNYGISLNDIGFEPMLTKFMDGFIRPMSKVLFPEVGGSTIDSHHSFIVQFGEYRNTNLPFHVDEAEVTLNVCLGDQFSDGQTYFRGVRCGKHQNQNSETEPEENFEYFHFPGHALLHRGRHRHGARATTSGHRLNLVLWCRSSVFQEMMKHQEYFPDWCDVCSREKKRKQLEAITAARQGLRSVVRRADIPSLCLDLNRDCSMDE